MKTWILVLFVSLIICLSISPVMAVTLLDEKSGTLGVSSPTITYVTKTPATDPNNRPWLVLGIDSEDTTDLSGLTSVYATTPTLAVPVSGYADVDLVYSGTKIGEGHFIWSRDYSVPETEMLLTIDTLDITSLPASAYIDFRTGGTLWSASKPVVIGASANNLGYCRLASDLNAAFGSQADCYTTPAQYRYGYIGTFQNSYNVYRYSNFVNQINITKTVGSDMYPSRIRIFTSGNVVFADEGSITNSSYTYYTMTIPLGISAQTNLGTYYNTSLFFTANYNISLSADEISPGGSLTGTLYSQDDFLLGGVTGVAWDYSDETGYHELYEGGNSSRPLDYVLTSGTWYGYDKTLSGYSISKGATIPNPVTISGITSTGNKTIICYVFTSDGNYYTLSELLTVGEGAGESGRVLVRAIDWSTNDQVAGAEINIKNLATGAWSNETTITGRREFYSPVGSRLYIEAYKSGYDRAHVSMFQITGLMDSQTITLFPTGSGSSDIANTTLYVSTYDAVTYDLKRGVTVTIKNDGQVKVTDNSGTVSFTVINGSAYTVRAGCSANNCVSQTKTETVSGAAYNIQFYLESLYATTAPTLAPGQTATPTAVPTVDMRTNEEKGAGMVKMLYDNGETIVMLCIIMTILGLLGYKPGK